MPKAKSRKAIAWPMRIQARKGSPAEKAYYYHSTLPGNHWPMPEEIARASIPRRWRTSFSTQGRTADGIPEYLFRRDRRLVRE
jgi:hypothetical protein